MSLYNAINGYNQAVFYILPMLGKHPDKYPRFRDCFAGEVSNDDEKMDEFGIPSKKANQKERVISVYTRVGGGNREAYEKEINKLTSMPNYLKDYDDDFDNTFAIFLFSVPKEFEADYDLLLNGEFDKVSQQYVDKLCEVYPKLEDKFREIFKK